MVSAVGQFNTVSQTELSTQNTKSLSQLNRANSRPEIQGMETPRQAICGPTHCSNRVLSVLNIGEGSKSTKTEQKMQGGDSEKKKSNSDINQDGPQ